MKIVTVN